MLGDGGIPVALPVRHGAEFFRVEPVFFSKLAAGRNEF
jgi:hypothetical protein